MFGSSCVCAAGSKFNTIDNGYACASTGYSNRSADTDSTIYDEGSWINTAI